MSDYYARTAKMLDNGPAFATEQDRRNEDRIQAVLEAAWNIKLHRYEARYEMIDWYGVRDGRVVVHVELKSRSHPAGRYPTVYLNFRKWNALMMSYIYTAVPSLFVVRFADGEVRWIDIREVNPQPLEVGGCNRLVKSKTDREPVIQVPVAEMHRLGRAG